ncbi:MAG: ATP-binding cassette domain-containing protein [Dehalococcoidia bacterium]|nr:ATP-binding cassette domain-containing protein [Dehalococcoidia bacterium]
MNEPVVTARSLTKHYGDLVAVDGVNFDVVDGECFGILGPNGAGKTTTIRMITCVSPVTAGHLEVLGMDVAHRQRDIKARLGVVPQDDNLDPDLTVLQNLLVYARYFDLPSKLAKERAWEGIRLFQLEDKVNERIEHLSGGLKRRLTIARGLINDPLLMVLDEPTTGLDPQARHMVWQKLRQLKQKGITMLLTTHYMEEAARLCDRLVIVDKARIIAQGTPGELIGRHVGTEVIEIHVTEGGGHRLLDELRGDPGGHEIEEYEDSVYLFIRDGSLNVDLGELTKEGHEVIRRLASLEDVFLRLAGRGLVE